MSITTQHSARQGSAGTNPARPAWKHHRTAISLGALPVTNLVVLEIGLAIGLVLVVIDNHLATMITSAGIAVIAITIAFSRVKRRWGAQWISLACAYVFRQRSKAEDMSYPEREMSLLRLILPDLMVSSTTDHDGMEIGLAWHAGVWTALIDVQTPAQLVTSAYAAPDLPLNALVACMQDRGIVLDSIQVHWHGHPVDARVPDTSPILPAYLEVLGSLPTATRYTTLLAINLDPRRCSAAIDERGGGMLGAHKALVTVIARIRGVLTAHGLTAATLSRQELLAATLSSAQLINAVTSAGPVDRQEAWRQVTVGGIRHSSFAIAHWPATITGKITTLTSLGALSSTVTLGITSDEDIGQAGLRGLVRISSRHPQELDQADKHIRQIAEHIGIALTPLTGAQLAGLAATLPLGGIR